MVSVVSEPEELTEIRCVTILANIVTLYAVKNHLKRPKSTWGGGGGRGVKETLPLSDGFQPIRQLKTGAFENEVEKRG